MVEEPFLKKERGAKEVELFREIIECITKYKAKARKIYGNDNVDIIDVITKLLGHFKNKGNFWQEKEEKKPLIITKKSLNI